MKIFSDLSIKNKLMVILMTTSGVVLLLACLGFAITEYIDRKKILRDELSGIANIIVANSIAPLVFKDLATGKEVMDALKGNTRITAAAIYDDKNRVFAHYLQAGKPATWIPENSKIQGDYSDDDQLNIFRPIYFQNKKIGDLFMRVNMDYMQPWVLHNGLSLILVFLISAGVSFFLSSKLQKTISQPILSLARAADRVSNGEKDIAINIKSNDELGELARAFKVMMAKTDQSMRDIQKINLDLKMAHDSTLRASQAKSDFLSHMSHELRTPMNAILGFAQLIDYEKDKDLLTTSQKRHVHEIQKAGYHLLKLIDEILDLSRIESGNVALSIQNFNFKVISDEAMSWVNTMAAAHQIRVQNNFQDVGDLWVLADPTKLKQVLLNLLSNAIKYNRANGTLTVDYKILPKGRLAIQVQDTGTGIPSEKLSELFEPFYRLDADKNNIEGTGIGLSIAKRLMELMGGSISAESVLGRGSTFQIEIPLGKKPTPAATSHSPAKSNQIDSSKKENSGRTILYVEDNAANLLLIREILSVRENTQFICAKQADDGLQLAHFHKPDLILMDINLPGMDGVTAMKKLKEDLKTSQIPVIAVSANAMKQDIADALEKGFDDYITKPIKVDLFLQLIDKNLNAKSKMGAQ
jgi:signal transduction histidine kinase/ActR/RegA family two-component response regulator